MCFAYFRAGCGMNVVDNLHSGGIKFPINIKMVSYIQVRINSKRPISIIEIAGQFVQDWEKIKDYVCKAHLLAPKELHWIGLDVCWSDGELCLIEGCKSGFFTNK